MSLPLVGVTSCTFTEDTAENAGQAYYKVGDKYMRSVMESVGALPVLLPAFGDKLDIDAVLDRMDGLLFTGSVSNVHPNNYDAEASKAAEPYDPIRDATTLPLLKAAVERGMPTLCICRGFQELNVVMGGTLYPRVHEINGRDDHRRPDGPIEVQYGPKHTLNLTDGGLLGDIVKSAGLKKPLSVNSLHYQAVNDLGQGLRIDAVAPDGTVEAMSLEKPNGFMLAVQWHPEYKSTENALSRAIFDAFAKAIAEHRNL